MAEYQNHDGSGQRRRRRGGRNRNQGGRPEPRPTPRSAPKPTGFQRFLNIISFGLLGKPAPRSASASRPNRQESAPSSGSSARSARVNSSEQRPPREPREPRSAPTPAEVTTDRLYIGNLSYDATESDLFELFNGVGSVKNAEVVVNSRTQRSKGFAFITMASVDEAKRAVAELHGKEFMGRALQLSGAKPPPARGDDDSHQPSDAEHAPAGA
jgi:RNA recognition motif-containing protein